MTNKKDKKKKKNIIFNIYKCASSSKDWSWVDREREKNYTI